MDIKDYFAGLSQDDVVERFQRVLRFRDRLYAGGGDVNGETIASYALFGLHFGYPPCCVLHFCEQAFDGTGHDAPIPKSGYIPCPRCRMEIENSP